MGSISASRYGFSIKIPGETLLEKAAHPGRNDILQGAASGFALRKYGNIVTTFLPQRSS
jgi:hypothetical protein